MTTTAWMKKCKRTVAVMSVCDDHCCVCKTLVLKVGPKDPPQLPKVGGSKVPDGTPAKQEVVHDTIP